MREATEAMRRIETSSKQIANINSVIDEIAFQTNLLALNAGVEAARAGEAGKGFAVVAQEVRELALRCSGAAKEIGELIRNSAVSVSDGARLVNVTGEELRAIAGLIQRVDENVDAIANGAREQSTALAEVSTAVVEMDKATQQNAAMVEEMNAAGAPLPKRAGSSTRSSPISASRMRAFAAMAAPGSPPPLKSTPAGARRTSSRPRAKSAGALLRVFHRVAEYRLDRRKPIRRVLGEAEVVDLPNAADALELVTHFASFAGLDLWVAAGSHRSLDGRRVARLFDDVGAEQLCVLHLLRAGEEVAVVEIDVLLHRDAARLWRRRAKSHR